MYINKNPRLKISTDFASAFKRGMGLAHHPPHWHVMPAPPGHHPETGPENKQTPEQDDYRQNQEKQAPPHFLNCRQKSESDQAEQ